MCKKTTYQYQRIFYSFITFSILNDDQPFMLVWHVQYSDIRLTFTLLLLTERFDIKTVGKLGLLMRVGLLGICGGGSLCFVVFCVLACLL